MAGLNAYTLELSSEEMNVLQVSIDYILEHLSDLYTDDPSDRDVHRRLDAAHRLKKWISQEET